jgi:hypothetical protein
MKGMADIWSGANLTIYGSDRVSRAVRRGHRKQRQWSLQNTEQANIFMTFHIDYRLPRSCQLSFHKVQIKMTRQRKYRENERIEDLLGVGWWASPISIWSLRWCLCLRAVPTLETNHDIQETYIIKIHL